MNGIGSRRSSKWDLGNGPIFITLLLEMTRTACLQACKYVYLPQLYTLQLVMVVSSLFLMLRLWLRCVCVSERERAGQPKLPPSLPLIFFCRLPPSAAF